MNDLVALVPFYNDFKALQRLLLYLSKLKISSILCDGRFTNFKQINNSDVSTDGSRFLIQGFKNTALIEIKPCLIEEKFNKLFHEAEKQGYAYAMLLGADEYIEGNAELLKKKLASYNQSQPTLLKVPFVDHTKKRIEENNFIERIFFQPGSIQARGSHRTFYSATDQAKGIKKLIKSDPVVVQGITIHHDNTIRTKERNELMKEYQKKINQNKFD